MSCHSKWCSTLQAISQVAIAAVFIYAGLVVNSHMESWTESFKQGSDDLHSIRTNMNTIAYSMESINRNVKTAANLSNEINNNIEIISKEISRIDYSVNNIQRNFSPQGMMRSMMPF